MENKDWIEEIEKDFDELFFEGERNSVYCKKHKVLATPFEVKSFARFQLEKILKSKQEEMEKKIEEWKPIQWDEQSLAEMKQDLKELLSNK